MELGPVCRALIHNATRFWLITLEVALTLAIVVNCVSMILDNQNRFDRPTGLDVDNLLVVVSEPYAEDFAAEGFLDTVRDEDLRRLRALPGVRAATATSVIPLSGSGTAYLRRPVGDQGDGLVAPCFDVADQALETLGVELIAGRDFAPEDFIDGDDGQARNVILTRAMADRFFPDGDALGSALDDAEEESEPETVIGVVERMHSAWPRSPFAELAVLRPGPPAEEREMFYMVRTEPAALESVLPELEPTLLAVNQGRILTVRTLDEYKRRYYVEVLIMIKVLGAVVVLLVGVTSLGIIGLTSFSVTQRFREIGTRRAMGATRTDILRYFLLENWVITGIGLALGVLLSYALNYGLVHLAGAPKIGWGLLAGLAVALWASGLLAALAPALRATLVPPVVATRTV